MSKIWDKTGTSLNPLVEDYTVGNDHITDIEFIQFDIEASIAHAKGLEKIGILSKEETSSLLSELNNLSEEIKKNGVVIPKELEDCHTFIESKLTDKLGDIGKKIHTGRSRNDQSLTMIRLWQIDKIKQNKELLKSLIRTLLGHAKRYESIPFPGYSHTQQAMLISVGHLYASYAESLINDLEFLSYAEKMINKSPLGSGAGFGSNLALDREFTANSLGFDGLNINSLYAQNTRGKIDSIFAEALSQIMLSLTKVANDMLIFTTREFAFFSVDQSITTGSSIMPQKRNMDLLEILKGNTSLVISDQLALKNIFKDGLSGYNREIQHTKNLIINIEKITSKSIKVIELFFNSIVPNEVEISKKIQRDIFSADIATEMSESQGIPFRDAYKIALEKAEKGHFNLQDELIKKKSLGSAGNLGLDLLEDKLNSL